MSTPNNQPNNQPSDATRKAIAAWERAYKTHRETAIDFAVHAASEEERHICIQHKARLQVAVSPWHVHQDQGIATSRTEVACPECKHAVTLDNNMQLPHAGMSQREVVAFMSKPEIVAAIQEQQEITTASASLLYNIHVLDRFMAQRLAQEFVEPDTQEDVSSAVTEEVDALLEECDRRIVAREEARGELSPAAVIAHWRALRDQRRPEVEEFFTAHAGEDCSITCIQHPDTTLLMGWEKDVDGDYLVTVRCPTCHREAVVSAPVHRPTAAESFGWSSQEKNEYAEREAQRVMRHAVTTFYLHVLDGWVVYTAMDRMTPARMARYRRLAHEHIEVEVGPLVSIRPGAFGAFSPTNDQPNDQPNDQTFRHPHTHLN